MFQQTFAPSIAKVVPFVCDRHRLVYMLHTGGRSSPGVACWTSVHLYILFTGSLIGLNNGAQSSPKTLPFVYFIHYQCFEAYVNTLFA